jgi:hypothetical protein
MTREAYTVLYTHQNVYIFGEAERGGEGNAQKSPTPLQLFFWTSPIRPETFEFGSPVPLPLTIQAHHNKTMNNEIKTLNHKYKLNLPYYTHQKCIL